MGLKISKHYSYSFHSFSTKLFLNVPCNNPHKTWFLEFWNFKFKLVKKDWNLSLCPMEKWKSANISEMANRRANEVKSQEYRYLWPFNVQGHFGVIRCSCLKVPCNSKTAGLRTKQWNWDSGILIHQHIWGTFDLLVFKVIFGSFSALVSKRPGTRKQLTIEWKGVKFGTRGTCNLCMGYLDLLVFKVILGSFGALVSNWPVTRKQLTVERNRVKLGTRGYLFNTHEVPLTIWCSMSFLGHSVHMS